MTAELSTSLVDTINEAHQEFLACSRRSVQSLIDQVNAARAVGEHLKGLKEQTRHGEWLGLFATAEGRPNPNPVLDFDAQTGRLYMRIRERLDEPVTSLPDAVRSLKDMMVSVGALPESSRGEQESHGPSGWLTIVTKHLSKTDAELNKQLGKAPMEEWEPHVVENFVEQSNCIAEANLTGKQLLRKMGRDQ